MADIFTADGFCGQQWLLASIRENIDFQTTDEKTTKKFKPISNIQAKTKQK